MATLLWKMAFCHISGVSGRPFSSAQRRSCRGVVCASPVQPRIDDFQAGRRPLREGLRAAVRAVGWRRERREGVAAPGGGLLPIADQAEIGRGVGHGLIPVFRRCRDGAIGGRQILSRCPSLSAPAP